MESMNDQYLAKCWLNLASLDSKSYSENIYSLILYSVRLILTLLKFISLATKFLNFSVC